MLKLAALVAALALGAPSAAQEPAEAARQLFAQYVALEQAYDPAIADLYADEALIKKRRNFPMGDPRDITFDARGYKKLLRASMEEAKLRGERNTYSKLTYAAEGAFVRISAARFSAFAKRTSPVSLLVGPAPSGKWLIYEELSESQH